MNIALKYKKEWNKPKGTQITRVPEGVEDSLFMSFFEGFWGIANNFKPDEEDLVANKHLKAADFMKSKVGTVNGIDMYVFNEDCNELTKIENSAEFGHFFDEEVYCIDIKGSEHRYSVIWQGKKIDSGLNSRCTETITQQLFDGCIDSSMTKASVRQCQEPESLLTFFPDGFYILNGKRVDMGDAVTKIKEGSLFAVMAPYGAGIRIIQQNTVSASRLNPHHVYTATLNEIGVLWMGQKACDNERAMGHKVLEKYTCEHKMVFNEGEETDEFWEKLGGKEDYAQVKDLLLQDVGFEPLLFEVSNSGGCMRMKQIACLAQENLLQGDVYIVDNF